MFKKFPLLYISFLYIFSTKDKIVFYMQQFSILVISLCVAVILCSFSLTNGWTQQFTQSILSNVSPIIVIPDISKSDNESSTLLILNEGFEKPKFQDSNIKSIEYIRQQLTFMKVEDKTYQVNVYENVNQTEPMAINKFLFTDLIENNLPAINIFDPASYSAVLGPGSRVKQYKNPTLNEDTSKSYVITMSAEEYLRLFRNSNYQRLDIDLLDPQKAMSTAAILKTQAPALDIKNWQSLNEDIFNMIELQKKIFLLIYSIMFILLCAIIIANNIAFFKEKRKDWALYSILNVIPNSVEKVFLYKNIILFLLSISIGLILGSILSVYSNEIISFIGYFTGTPISAKTLTGNDSLTYDFQLFDFILVTVFALVIFMINFIILISVYRKESTANLLRTQ